MTSATRMGWLVLYQQPGIKGNIVPCNEEQEWEGDRASMLTLDSLSLDFYICEKKFKIFLM